MYYKNKKLIKKKDPLNIYITRSYNFNDYNKNIMTKNDFNLKDKKLEKKKYLLINLI